MGVGLQFRKVDLHTHTPASKCFLDNSVTPEQIVQVAVSAGLDAVAITDHNSGAWIDRVREAATGTPLTVFPGVEITVAEGFHVVALFDTDKGTSDVTSFLGALEITPECQGLSDTFCRDSAHHVIERIVDWGGLAILAHCDAPKGVLTALRGAQLISLINEARYSALEVSNGDPPPNLSKDRGYKRFPACYQCSDSPHRDDPKKHSHEGLATRYSYFKLDKVINLEGLRQCFTDPDVRIRKMGSLEETPFPRVVSLRASEGFLKHQNIRFHQGLNSIIGGKGVGKSLIIEFLRFVLDQPSEDEDILKDYNGKLKKRLGPLNYAEVVCQMPSGTQYKITRTLNGACECVDVATGQQYDGRIGDLFPILAYSQTEVVKIAEDEEAQLKLMDSFIDTRIHTSRIEKINQQLQQSDKHLAAAIRAGYELASFQQDVDTIDAQVAEINKSLTGNEEEASLFKAFKGLESKKQAFEARKHYLAELSQFLDETSQKVENTSPPQMVDEQKADADLTWAQDLSAGAKQAILSALQAANTDVKERDAQIGKRFEEWRPTFEAKEVEYKASLHNESHKQVLEASRQVLLERREQALSQLDGCTSIASGLGTYRSQRIELLDNLDKSYEGYFAERKRMFDTLTERSDGKLKLELTHATNRKSFQDELKLLVRGSGARAADIVAIAEAILPRQFVALACKRDVDSLANDAAITRNSAQTILDKLWSGETIEPVLALEHSCYPGDVPSIQFRKDDSQYSPLTELSVGQKCTALMIIALSEGTRPVIIDQPEDSLDIRTVWEDVSMKLRLGKERRQFILTTHNPSVSVASDSDMFIVVKSNATLANVKCLGAIEHPNVRQAVIQHLEGGEEPYQLRLQKYNWKS